MDLKEMWLRSKTLYFNDTPLFPQEVMEMKSSKQLARFSNAANEVKLRSQTLKWPAIPDELAKAVEEGKDEERVMAWELLVKETIFLDPCRFFRTGYCNSKWQLPTIFPNKPELCGTYTDEQMLMLHNYGVNVAQTYTMLVPDISYDSLLDPPELREWCYAVYCLYSRKPEVIPIMFQMG